MKVFNVQWWWYIWISHCTRQSRRYFTLSCSYVVLWEIPTITCSPYTELNGFGKTQNMQRNRTSFSIQTIFLPGIVWFSSSPFLPSSNILWVPVKPHNTWSCFLRLLRPSFFTRRSVPKSNLLFSFFLFPVLRRFIDVPNIQEKRFKWKVADTHNNCWWWIIETRIRPRDTSIRTMSKTDWDIEACKNMLSDRRTDCLNREHWKLSRPLFWRSKWVIRTP